MTLVVTLGLGCAVGVGNRSPSGTTLGQELNDLKAALDNNAITHSEYETQKRRLLNERGGQK